MVNLFTDSMTTLPGIQCFIGRHSANCSPTGVDWLHDVSSDLAAMANKTACANGSDVQSGTLAITPDDALFEDFDFSIFQTTTSVNVDPCLSSIALQLFDCLFVDLPPDSAEKDVTSNSVDDSCWSCLSPLSPCSYESDVGEYTVCPERDVTSQLGSIIQ